MKYEVSYFIHLPMKMEPIVSSETSAIRTQTPGNYPKRNNLQIQFLSQVTNYKFQTKCQLNIHYIRMKNLPDKICRENQNTHFVYSNFFFFENPTV